MKTKSSPTSKFALFNAILGLIVLAVPAFGQVTPDAVLSFESVTDLRAYDTSTLPTPVPQAITAGYYAAGDDGGNQFYWASSTTASDNGGTVIKPTAIGSSSPGRWIATKTSNLSVRVFGAKGNGTADDAPSFGAAFGALPGGIGEVYAPAGNYRFASTLVITGIGKSLRGSGPDSTTITVDLGVSTAIQLGVANSSYWKGKISNLRISRAAGTVTSSMVGISAQWFSYGVMEDLWVARQGVGIKTSDTWESNSLGLELNRVLIQDSLIHVWLKDMSEAHLEHCNFGVNGPEAIAPGVLLLIDGTTNDVKIHSTQFIPRTSGNSAVAFKWINQDPDWPGYYRFDDINIENAATAFQSDATSPIIYDLAITLSRLTPTGKLFDFNAATALGSLSFVNNSINFGTASTLKNASKSKFSGNTSSGTLTFDGGDWVVNDNTFNSTIVFTGAFNPLILKDNSLAFDGTVTLDLNTTAATGPITKEGNSSDTSTQANDPRLAGTMSPVVSFVATLPLTSVNSVDIFTVPANKTFVLLHASAVLTSVASYNGGTLPAIAIDTGPASPQMATSAASTNWNAIGRSLPIMPAANGIHSVCPAGQVVRAVSCSANTSGTLVASVVVFGFYY